MFFQEWSFLDWVITSLVALTLRVFYLQYCSYWLQDDFPLLSHATLGPWQLVFASDRVVTVGTYTSTLHEGNTETGGKRCKPMAQMGMAHIFRGEFNRGCKLFYCNNGYPSVWPFLHGKIVIPPICVHVSLFMTCILQPLNVFVAKSDVLWCLRCCHAHGIYPQRQWGNHNHSMAK